MILQFVFVCFALFRVLYFYFFCFPTKEGVRNVLRIPSFVISYYGLHRLQGTYPILMTSSLLPV